MVCYYPLAGQFGGDGMLLFHQVSLLLMVHFIIHWRLFADDGTLYYTLRAQLGGGGTLYYTLAGQFAGDGTLHCTLAAQLGYGGTLYYTLMAVFLKVVYFTIPGGSVSGWGRTL